MRWEPYARRLREQRLVAAFGELAQFDDHGCDPRVVHAQLLGFAQQAHHGVPLAVHRRVACLQLDSRRFEFADSTQDQFVLADRTERSAGSTGSVQASGWIARGSPSIPV